MIAWRPAVDGGASRQSPDRSSWERTLLELPVLIVTAAVIAFLLKTFLAQAFYIPSGSMLPQLQLNDRVVVSKLSYRLHEPRRGDIVVFDDPDGGSRPKANLVGRVLEGIGLKQPSTDEFIKRVVALPGETVEGRDGRVYVDGKLVEEPYLPPGVVTSAFPPRLIPPETLWVMGDNRTNSRDSRSFGPIRRSSVVGRAVLKVWPLPSASFL